MQLAQPVTVQPPVVLNAAGESISRDPYTLTHLNVTIIDNAMAKRCIVQMAPFTRQLPLWINDEYDAAGDYTQADVEARILELLGDDLKAGLEALFGPVPPPAPPAPEPEPAPEPAPPEVPDEDGAE